MKLKKKRQQTVGDPSLSVRCAWSWWHVSTFTRVSQDTWSVVSAGPSSSLTRAQRVGGKSSQDLMSLRGSPLLYWNNNIRLKCVLQIKRRILQLHNLTTSVFMYLNIMFTNLNIHISYKAYEFNYLWILFMFMLKVKMIMIMTKSEKKFF